MALAAMYVDEKGIFDLMLAYFSLWASECRYWWGKNDARFWACFAALRRLNYIQESGYIDRPFKLATEAERIERDKENEADAAEQKRWEQMRAAQYSEVKQ